MSDPVLAKLDQLRRLPGVWIQLNCSSRLEDEIAWSLTCKYGVRHNVVQYVSTSLEEVVDKLAEHLHGESLAAPAEAPRRKLKLKRSTS